ncbi:sodium channel, voltage-gated, type I, beta b [Triplophysa dalaica]|uniref:sodium channel, voltage-gated, type I, beta b n=1 Tax=Triplophysa dalaica TaxID=1582913 RepID=UPI0024DFED45|nr:sodium channel, voltage-gated, type I, beta b [Triplophysa dalaica]
MNVFIRRLLSLCVFCALSVSLCSGACAEVDSDTEAVAGHGFQLGCLSCKVRLEVPATATVDWLFRAPGWKDFVHIYTYDGESPNIIHEQFQDRIQWHGSKKTFDLQDATINLLNVTFNDSGTYVCIFNRILKYEHYEFPTIVKKNFTLTVVPTARRGTASIVSEVMMYVSIIGLQFWLLVEMIYCYRKIAAAGEEALRASAAEYLAITSESKDNCAGVQVAE